MKGKDITSVNKIVTNDLDVNNQIDMKSKKIVNLADGTVNNDAVNKAQLISMQASLVSQINTLNNKLNAINNKVTNDGYYYFTNQLKHNSEDIAKFPSDIDKYPFKSVTNNNTKLRLLVSGYYHVIYIDNCRYCVKFEIYDDTNSTTKFITGIISNDSYSQFTINSVINVQTHDGFGHADIELKAIKTVSSNPQLEGTGDSSFFIKYLHP